MYMTASHAEILEVSGVYMEVLFSIVDVVRVWSG